MPSPITASERPGSVGVGGDGGDEVDEIVGTDDIVGEGYDSLASRWGRDKHLFYKSATDTIPFAMLF